MSIFSFVLIFVCFVSQAQAYELFKVDKEILKKGLHRDMVTNVTFRIDSTEEFDKCSFIFIENVTKDAYIYYEEVKKLKDFEFFPHIPMNIEAPASISEDTEFMWRLPFNKALSTNDYIFDINVVEDHPNSTKEHPVKYPTWSV